MKLKYFGKDYNGFSVIYMITNPIGQIYIGATDDLLSRIRHHANRYKFDYSNSDLLSPSIEKYGMDAHTIEVLYSSKVCSKEQLFKKEGVCIKKYKSCFLDNNEFGLNLRRSNYDNEHCRLKMPHQKPVYQYDLITGAFISEFKTIHEASRSIGKEDGYKNISNVCLGKRRYAYKFYWSFDKQEYYKPIVSWKNKKSQKILKLYSHNSELHDTYSSISEAASKNNVTSTEMFHIIKNKRLFNNSFIFIKAA